MGLANTDSQMVVILKWKIVQFFRSINDIDTFLPYDEAKINLMEGFTELNSDGALPF